MSTDTDTRPPPPFLGIKPCPDQVAACPRKNLVFGFPISYEWFAELYEVMKKKEGTLECSQQFLSTTTALAELCQAMYPDWRHISVVRVACGNYGDVGNCALIRVGTAGWRPPKEVILEMAEELRKFGLVEHPNWFPGIGLKSTYQCYESVYYDD